MTPGRQKISAGRTSSRFGEHTTAAPMAAWKSRREAEGSHPRSPGCVARGGGRMPSAAATPRAPGDGGQDDRGSRVFFRVLFMFTTSCGPVDLAPSTWMSSAHGGEGDPGPL